MNWALVVVITYSGLLGFCGGCIFTVFLVEWCRSAADPDAD